MYFIHELKSGNLQLQDVDYHAFLGRFRVTVVGGPAEGQRWAEAVPNELDHSFTALTLVVLCTFPSRNSRGPKREKYKTQSLLIFQSPS